MRVRSGYGVRKTGSEDFMGISSRKAERARSTCSARDRATPGSSRSRPRRRSGEDFVVYDDLVTPKCSPTRGATSSSSRGQARRRTLRPRSTRSTSSSSSTRAGATVPGSGRDPFVFGRVARRPRRSSTPAYVGGHPGRVVRVSPPPPTPASAHAPRLRFRESRSSRGTTTRPRPPARSTGSRRRTRPTRSWSSFSKTIGNIARD